MQETTDPWIVREANISLSQEDDQYLFSLISPGSAPSDFNSELFLSAIRTLLAEEGYSGVEVELHGIYLDGDLQ